MIPQTVGRRYDVGRLAPVQCVTNDTLKDLDIKDNCFLLLILREGTAQFRVGGKSFEATAPCFVCFDEREEPRLTKKLGLKCAGIFTTTFILLYKAFPHGFCNAANFNLF